MNEGVVTICIVLGIAAVCIALIELILGRPTKSRRPPETLR